MSPKSVLLHYNIIYKQLTFSQNAITLEEIENVDGLVKKLEKIELPNQLVAVLGDPLLQKFLLLKPDADANQRVNNWLSSYAYEMMSGDSDANTMHILSTLRDYASATKVRENITGIGTSC